MGAGVGHRVTRESVTSVVRAAALFVVSLAWTSAMALDEVRVFCDPTTGEITVGSAGAGGGLLAMTDVLPGARTAEIWVDESCPTRRCDSAGRCVLTDSDVDPEGWYVLCNLGSGDIGLVQGAVPAGFSVMTGPVATEGQATEWVEASCPSWSCRPPGECTDSAVSTGADRAQPASELAREAASTGWTAGRVTIATGSSDRRTVALGSGGWTVGEVVTGASTGSSAGYSDVVGPHQTSLDLRPLINAARVSVAACAYPTALANADQMARFDPSNPWLEANHERLRQLAQRQRNTEQAIWLASTQLAAGKLKDARKTVFDAADMAVACQDEAVSLLLNRIDEVMAHRKAERWANNGRVFGDLLAGLFVVNQAVSAHYGGTPTATGAGAAPVVAVVGGTADGAADPCSFNYSYPNVWVTEPACGCSGYHFDPTKLRCVR
jgi:hypothetical protein